MRAAYTIGGCLVAALLLAGASPPTGGNLQVFGKAWRVRVTPHTMWQFPVRETATPTADKRRTFVGGNGGKLYAVHARTGEVDWTFEVGGALASEPKRHKDLVIFGSNEGTVHALLAVSGREQWRYRSKAPITSRPTLGKDADGKFTVYVTNALNTLIALDAETGAWRWHYQRDLPLGMALLRTSSPATQGDRVYVGFSDGVLAAVAQKDGAVQWTKRLVPSGERFGDVDGTPHVDAKRELLVLSVHQRGVVALSLADGTQRWERELRAPSDTTCDRATCFVAAGNRIYRLSLDDGRVFWSHTVAQKRNTKSFALRPRLLDRYVVFPRSDGLVNVVEREFGDLQQRFRFPEGLHGEVAVSRAGLYALLDSGVAYGMRYLDAPLAGRSEEIPYIPKFGE